MAGELLLSAEEDGLVATAHLQGKTILLHVNGAGLDWKETLLCEQEPVFGIDVADMDRAEVAMLALLDRAKEAIRGHV